MKSLRSTGRSQAARAATRYSSRALEIAARRSAPTGRSRRLPHRRGPAPAGSKSARIRPRLGRRLLDLGDQPVAAGGDLPSSAARSRAAAPAAFGARLDLGERPPPWRARDLLALVGADLGEDVAHARDAFVAARLRRLPRPCRSRSTYAAGPRPRAGPAPGRRRSSAAAAVQQHDVAQRRLPAGQHVRASPAALCAASPPLRSARRARRQPDILRRGSRSPRPRRLPARQHQLAVGGRELVEAVLAVHDQARSQPELAQHLGHRPHPVGGEHADQLALDPGRVGHRPEQVEDGAAGPSSTRGPATLRIAE